MRRATGEGPAIEVYGPAGEHKASADGTFPAISGAGEGTADPDGYPRVLSLRLELSSEYESIGGSPWANVAEPHRKTTFTAVSTLGHPKADVFTWSIEGGTTLEGREVSHIFTTTGLRKVQLAQTVSSTGETYTMEDTVMVKYVRREIRQLTKIDREAFLDAMEKIYRLSPAAGQDLYGKEFKGIDYFVQMHLEGAGVTDCDHWHDDAGIMTHHVGFTLMFEQALQVIDPSVCIPYWEYTIEAMDGSNSYGESIIFSDDWLGDASPDNDFHTVDKGRWAFLPVNKQAWWTVHNSYGLLRAPWNTDPTPYVTRHNMTNAEASTDMVSCDDYQSCFDAVSLAEMNNCLNGGTHGPVHIITGGEWNDPQEELITALGISAMVPLLSKYFWRKGYLRIRDSCTEEKDGVGEASTCRAACPADVYESRGMTPYEVLVDTMALYWVTQASGGVIEYLWEEERFVVAGHEYDEQFQQALWKKLLDALCDPGHVGDMYTSSAPYDPLFWVIHPSAERLMNWRRKVAADGVKGYEFDEQWGYTHGSVVGETGMVCNWADVEDGSLDLPTCSKGICGGHAANDMLPFTVKINGESVMMTNAEWLALIYPDNEELPYMYNEYRWDHCAANGNTLGTFNT